MRGLEKLLALGAYPDVALKRGRERRDEARNLIADGICPSIIKRRAERSAPAETFEAVASERLELQRKSLAPETMSILGTRISSFLYPYVGGRAVAAVSAQELLTVLRRIEARGRHETARRVRALAGRELRKMMQTWADYLDRLRDGAQVIPLRRQARQRIDSVAPAGTSKSRPPSA